MTINTLCSPESGKKAMIAGIGGAGHAPLAQIMRCGGAIVLIGDIV